MEYDLQCLIYKLKYQGAKNSINLGVNFEDYQIAEKSRFNSRTQCKSCLIWLKLYIQVDIKLLLVSKQVFLNQVHF